MSDSGLSKFATPDAIAALLVMGASPLELSLRLGGVDDQAIANKKDLYDGFKLYLLNNYDYSKIFTEITEDIEQFVEVCSALAETDVITDVMIKVINSRNGPDTFTPESFENIVEILQKAPEEIQKMFLTVASSPNSLTHEQEVDDRTNFEKPFSPQTRLGIALTAALAEGFMLDASSMQGRPLITEPRGDKYVASYSPVELCLAFKRSLPKRALPELLASTAFEAYKSGGLMAAKYSHLFDPNSQILNGMSVSDRNLLARRFMKYFGVKLSRQFGPTSAVEILQSTFGQFIDSRRDFNSEIRASIKAHLPSGKRL